MPGTVANAHGLARAWGILGALALIVLCADPREASARELHVRESSPAAETIVHGDHAQYVVRFDGPVNHAASRLSIMQGDHVVQTLRPLLDSAVDVLYASGRVPDPGSYSLHWEAVSADGDRTAGDIPFKVQR